LFVFLFSDTYEISWDVMIYPFRQAMMNYVQASYRHGYVPANDNRNYDRGHQSYVNVEGEGDSVTRFFAPLDPDE